MPAKAKAKSARKTASARKPKLPDLTFTRVIDAPRSVVWDAWTKSEHLKRWFAPNQFTTPVADIDLRKGGTLRVVMRAPDGQEFTSLGTVKLVKRPEKLVWSSWLNGSDGKPMLVDETTIQLAESRGKTKLTVRARIISMTDEAKDAAGGMEQGWNETLDRLVQLAVSLARSTSSKPR